MIKSIGMANWKSFAHSQLFIDPLTILIGSNASGKSNALDAFNFLSKSTIGTPFSVIMEQMRGAYNGFVKTIHHRSHYLQQWPVTLKISTIFMR
ncbi:AAA family ATPase [Aeromonas caviae]|uniref:AAA family ATPase n=1 Tax=Aeromonas caviae TaxID=648 RepID=UPI0019200C11|nr:AAA family ATPase [Aeromonas caviae]